MNAVRTFSICALILCGLSGSTVQAQSWRKALEPSYPGVSFNDIFFFDVNHGWAVGSRGTVLYTTDGGGNGMESVIDTLLALQSVYFRDVNNGYVGASRRTLCMTTDGGANWTSTVVTQIDSASTIRAVYFADANRGWILSTLSSTNGKVAHTTDGGATWTVDLSLTGANSNLIDMDFWSADTGVVTGKSVGMLYYTTNGTTWTLAPTPTLGGFSYTRSDVRSVDMVSPTTAYAVGWGSTVGAQPSIHLKTTDGGATWTYMTQSAENRTYDNLYTVWFKDASNGLASGGGSILVRTTDAGANWIPLVLPTGATIYGLSGSGDDVWMDGSDGVLYHSTDFGTTWNLVIDIPSATINALQFASPSVGYAAGFDAIFLKTTNGGNDWKGSFVSAGGVSQNVNDIYFVNESLGFAAHSFRMISKTTDGGATWAKVLPDTGAATVSTLGIYFVDADTGYAVGQLSSSNGVVYKTTDAGASWVTKPAVATKTLRGVAFGDAAHGVVTGATRTMMYTANAGATWTAATLNNVPANRASVYMRRVRFLTSTTAIAVGDSTILRSTDAGATWEYVATASKTSLNNVEKADAVTAYAVGNGEVWKTTDAGLTWANIIDPAVVTGTLYSVAVDGGGEAWVGAASSTLYTTSGTVGVGDDAPLATGYQLSQNYPNPFNPATVISYQVPSASMVTLTVVDLLGRTVATLVNERKAAGSYDVRFEGAGLSTGMYLYRISAGGFVQTKKMLLVK